MALKKEITRECFQIKELDDFFVNLKWGNVQSCFGNQLSNEKNFPEISIDFSKKIPRAPFIRKIVSKQLISGHLRIDLNCSMTEGNLIVFEGERKAGKTTVAIQTAQNFLKNPNSAVVFVGLQNSSCEELLNSLHESEKQRVLCIGVEKFNSSDTEFLYAPDIGLRSAIEASY